MEVACGGLRVEIAAIEWVSAWPCDTRLLQCKWTVRLVLLLQVKGRVLCIALLLVLISRLWLG
jgi:hypothetical protein